MTLMQWLLSLIALAVAAAQPGVPRPSPEFAFQTLDGRQVLLSQQRGKVVVLEFLYTTCPHCRQASRVLSRLQNEYGPRGFQALGVAFNNGASMLAPEFVKENAVAYPVGLSDFRAVFSFLRIPTKGAKLPLIAVIDRKGVIRAQMMGDERLVSNEDRVLRAAIEPLLREK